MPRNIYGGGARTNENGLQFEQETSLAEAISAIGCYEIKGNVIFYKGVNIAILASKNNLYKVLLEPMGVDYKDILSKKLLPDDAIFVRQSNTVYIVEKKFQNTSGSVDEKLQTCGFKLSQYRKLFNPKNINVEYIYVLNDWFAKPQYSDVLDYIESCGCHYYFNEIPLDVMNLPHTR